MAVHHDLNSSAGISDLLSFSSQIGNLLFAVEVIVRINKFSQQFLPASMLFIDSAL
jgi:hypothetical protein